MVLFRVLIPCIMLFEWVTWSSIWRRMQVTRVSERPPVRLLQKTLLLNKMSICVPVIPRTRPTPAGQTKGPQSGIKKPDLVWGENYTHFFFFPVAALIREGRRGGGTVNTASSHTSGSVT